MYFNEIAGNAIIKALYSSGSQFLAQGGYSLTLFLLKKISVKSFICLGKKHF